MDPRNAWQAAVGQLQMDMSRASYETWVQPAELVRHEGDLFTIGVPNAYACDWLKSRLTATLNGILGGLMEAPQQVEFIVWHKDYENRDSEKESDRTLPLITTAVKEQQQRFNQRYTFDNFIVGSSNRLAHAACLAVAENPAQAYNPLFLYGGVGLGKTHLLHAIGNYAQAHGQSVLYVSSEEFTNDLINAIRTHTTQAFRDRYRRIDVLLVDDIQFIAGKESTQEEFFHTFNALHNTNRQIVLTSDRPPKDISSLEDRLRSRFEWGLVTDITQPDLETRIAILKKYCSREKVTVYLSDDILMLVAESFTSNIRELEGALTRVIAFSSLTKTVPSLEIVKSVLKDILPDNLETKITISKILKEVSKYYAVSINDLASSKRSSLISHARHVAMYLSRELTSASLPKIGRDIGNRDHPTVIYAVNKISALLKKDRVVYNEVQELTNKIKSFV